MSKKKGRPFGTRKQNAYTERVATLLTEEQKAALERHIRDSGYTAGTAPFIRELIEAVINPSGGAALYQDYQAPRKDEAKPGE